MYKLSEDKKKIEGGGGGGGGVEAYTHVKFDFFSMMPFTFSRVKIVVKNTKYIYIFFFFQNFTVNI